MTSLVYYYNAFVAGNFQSIIDSRGQRKTLNTQSAPFMIATVQLDALTYKKRSDVKCYACVNKRE